jgi:GNAT superfamily N-acetyltransferase
VDDPPPRERQLWFIYLLASAQGSGAGQALLDDVLGDEPASLWVFEANPRARAFYAKNGFVPDGARQPSGFDGAPDEIRMVR